MRILLLEYLTAVAPEDATLSLEKEGWSIVVAAASVLATEPGVEVWVAVNERLSHSPLQPGVQSVVVNQPFLESNAVAAEFDGVILVAPELRGIAGACAEHLDRIGAKLLSPPKRFIDWAADKLGLAQELPIVTPQTIVYAAAEPPLEWGETLIVKPQVGVGGLFTAIVERPSLRMAVHRIRERGFHGPLIVQPFVSGRSVSVAVIGRSNRPPIVLPAAEQFVEFTADVDVREIRWASYRGGRLPIPVPHERLTALIDPLCSVAPAFDGWIGVDCILADDGRDVIVDVNPRLTTSILGYVRFWPGACARLLLGRETTEDRTSRLRSGGSLCSFDVQGRTEITR